MDVKREKYKNVAQNNILLRYRQENLSKFPSKSTDQEYSPKYRWKLAIAKQPDKNFGQKSLLNSAAQNDIKDWLPKKGHIHLLIKKYRTKKQPKSPLNNRDRKRAYL